MQYLHHIDLLPWDVEPRKLNPQSDADMLNLGRENLEYLARFWKKRAEKMTAKAKEETDFSCREQHEQDAEASEYKASVIKELANHAESKPLLFEKPALKKGCQITCFLEEPTSHYVSGPISDIRGQSAEFANDEKETLIKATGVIFTIKVHDRSEPYKVNYSPDYWFTIMKKADFEYFRTHPEYFRLYLSYHAQTIPEYDKARKMYATILKLSDHPTAD